MTTEHPATGPDLSVIVYVHDAEGQVRSNLDSVVEAAPASAEILVVDDASPDGSRRIIAEFAAADRRIRSIQHPLAVGQSEALRQALGESAGTWVSFVDARDLVDLQHYVATLAAAEALEADLVVARVRDLSATGKSSDPQAECALDALAPDQTFTLGDHPRLVGDDVGLRARVYRRSLLEDDRFEFGADPRADVHAAAVAAVLAARIVVLDEPGCTRRCRFATGRPTPMAEALMHVVAATALDRRLAALGAPEEARRRAAAVSTAGLRQVHESLAPGDRHQVDLAITEHLNNDETPDHAVLLSRADLTFHEVLRRGVPRMYKITASADSAVSYLKAQRRKLRAQLREQRVNQRRRIGFGAAVQRPIDGGIAVFSADQGNTVTGSPLAVFEALVRRAPHMRCVWLLTSRADPEGLPDDAWVRRGTWDYYDLIGRARYFVSDGSFPGFVTKRPGSIEVHTPVTAPLRHVGVDVAGSAKDLAAELARARRWDYVLSSSAVASENLLGAYPADFRVLEIGQPANDLLHRHSELDVARIRRDLGIDPADLAVFHDSAWGSVPWAPLMEGLARFADSSGRRCHILSANGGRLPDPQGDVVVTTAGPADDLRELMIVSGLMVTDASPLMFDYCNLERPIVTFVPERTVAPATGCYVDIRNDHAGLLATSASSLVDLLAGGGWRDEKAAAAIAGFRQRFATFEDGSASDRLIELVFYDALANAS